MVVLMCRYVEVNPLSLLAQASWGPLLATAAASAAWIAAVAWLPNQWQPARSWIAFAGVGLLGAVPYAVVVLLLERDCAARRASWRNAVPRRSIRHCNL